VHPTSLQEIVQALFSFSQAFPVHASSANVHLASSLLLDFSLLLLQSIAHKTLRFMLLYLLAMNDIWMQVFGKLWKA